MENEIKKRGRPPKDKGYNSPFAVRLRNLSINLTQQEIADGVGVSRQNIGQFLLGNSQPDTTTLVRLADFFHVSTDFLLCRTDIKTPDRSIQSVCECTGLSEKAATLFAKMNDGQETDKPIDQEDWEQLERCINRNRLRVINKIVENDVAFTAFIDAVAELYDYEIPANSKELRGDADKLEKIVFQVRYSDMFRYRAQQQLEKILDDFDIRHTPELEPPF